jgi:hypothetical protein
METFVVEIAANLHAHSHAPVTVGSAAIKWANAWTHSDLDFYQIHYYDWVYEWFPYQTKTPASVGLTGKPVLMGEFPNAGLSALDTMHGTDHVTLPARSASQFASDLYDQGYAGALSWAFNDSSFAWDTLDLATFQASHACETRF